MQRSGMAWCMIALCHNLACLPSQTLNRTITISVQVGVSYSHGCRIARERHLRVSCEWFKD